MFINISNHPSSKWSGEQLKAAVELGNEVIDMPFPNIPASMGGNEVDHLVDQYIESLSTYKNIDCVHIMGEMVFTYKLVSALKASGIVCCASTTERIVSEKEDGTKVSVFKFVSFRMY